MKKIWKWVLGILLVVVVVGALVAVPFVMRSYMLANTTSNAGQTVPAWNGGPMMGGNQGGWQHPQVPGYNGQFDNRSGRRGGFERDFGSFNRFSPFGFGFMFLGGLLRLIPLALFGLLLYGVYWLGRRSGLRTAQAPAPLPVQPAPIARPVEVGDDSTPVI